MPKMKSHRGLKKRVKLTGNGKNKKGKSRSASIDKANLPAVKHNIKLCEKIIE